MESSEDSREDIVKNESILRELAPSALAFAGGAGFMHPNDVMLVIKKLNALDTNFDNKQHSSGVVELGETRVNWRIANRDHGGRVMISLD